MEKEIQITRNYSFWKHPIKWWKDRKKIALMNVYANSQWEHGMRDEVLQMQKDFVYHGTAIMDKDGKRVDPTILKV